MSTTQQPGKSTQIIAVTLTVIVMIFIVYKCSSSNESAELKKPWGELTYEGRQKWLEDYLKSPDDAGFQLISMMDTEIRNKFNHPEEVEFNERPTFLRARVVEADSGWVFVNGTGTAKNSFGVKTGFTYQCKLVLNDTKRQLERVDVAEHQ